MLCVPITVGSGYTALAASVKSAAAAWLCRPDDAAQEPRSATVSLVGQYHAELMRRTQQAAVHAQQYPQPQRKGCNSFIGMQPPPSWNNCSAFLSLLIQCMPIMLVQCLPVMFARLVNQVCQYNLPSGRTVEYGRRVFSSWIARQRCTSFSPGVLVVPKQATPPQPTHTFLWGCHKKATIG